MYTHCCYTTRKSNQMGYITDGTIEVVYNKNTQIAITVLEVKDKFKPISQYIKPDVLKQIEIKKENKKMKISQIGVGICPDCGKEDVTLVKSGIYAGLCGACKLRKQNARTRNKEYIPYINLPDEKKAKIDALRKSQAKKKEIEIPPITSTPTQIIENYYQVKAENNPAIAHLVDKPVVKNVFSPLSDQMSFINILKNNGCDIPENTLENTLDVLINTDKLKDIFMNITNNIGQQTMLDLEQTLVTVEKKLQHDWEYNGFQEADDIKFKGFLTWRRMLKGAIFFWKKLYQTSAITEIQKAWNDYVQNPDDKVLIAEDNTIKSFQITTESISTIYNTRKPFTRVFHAVNKDTAYNMFKQWMADRNLHEDPKKTTIVELNNNGSEDPRGKEN